MPSPQIAGEGAGRCRFNPLPEEITVFKIDVQIDSVRFTGLQALDFARRHGLPDTATLYVGSQNTTGVDWYVRVTVDESFARAWFSPTEQVEEATIPIELLARGDLVTVEGRPQVCGLAQLSPERAKELFVASRFREAIKEGNQLADKVIECLEEE